ncbi:MAG: hypothetical protein QN229_07260 [Desulfurococcaceae archaeon TW002]
MIKSEIERKALFARKDLVDRLSEVAKKKGCSLYSLVNEIFEIVLKAEDSGIDLRRVVEDESLLETAKKIGYVLVLENLLYEMMELTYKNAGNQAIKNWFEAGIWLAKHYTTSDFRDPVEAFLSSFKLLTWEALELTIKKSSKELYVRLANPKAPESYSVFLTAFLEGVLKVFGYKIISKETSRGFIKLEAVMGEASTHG